MDAQGNHHLHDQESERIYRDQIFNYFKPFLSPSLAPTAIILGGQPGSGKSILTKDIQNRYSGKIFCVIDGDFIRTFHPYWNFFLKNYESLAPEFTQKDANRWVERLLNDAVACKANLIIEGTMRNSEIPLNTAKMLKASNYQVEAHILATPSILSILGIYERYESQKSIQKFGRFSPLDKHEAAYSGIPKSIRALEKSGMIDSLFLYGRRIYQGGQEHKIVNLNMIYENHFKNNQWLYPPRGALYLERERKRNQTPEEKALILIAWTNILSYAYQRRDSSAAYISKIHHYRNTVVKMIKEDSSALKALGLLGFLEEWMEEL